MFISLLTKRINHPFTFQFCTIPSWKMTVFCAIFSLKKDFSKLINDLGQKHEKIGFYYIFSCQNCTIFYVCPKIFIICTIFPNFVSYLTSQFFNQSQPWTPYWCLRFTTLLITPHFDYTSSSFSWLSKM